MESPTFQNESESTFKCGFKTRKCPPQHKDLMEFEDELQKMISNVQFRMIFKTDLRMT